MRKFTLVGPKCGCMVVPSAVDVHRRMDNMEHLVKHHVFDDETRSFPRIERSTDNYRVLRRIVVTEYTVSLSL